MELPPLPSSADVRSSAPRRVLPRIRATRGSPTTDAIDASVSAPPATAEVVHDIVSPLSPTASEQQHEVPSTRPPRPAETDSTTRPLTRLLGRIDVAERCRWSGLVMVVFYVVTSLLWPSMFITGVGLACGGTGFAACLEPFTIQKILWVFPYAFLNAAMLGVLVWVALDQLVLHKDSGTDKNEQVSFLYTVAFLSLGSVLHVRSFQAARELIITCKLMATVAAALLPERWQRTPPQDQPVAPAMDVEEATSGHAQQGHEDGLARTRERSSSTHSFEIDLQWSADQVHIPDRQPSPLAIESPPASPSHMVTPFEQIDEPTASAFDRRSLSS